MKWIKGKILWFSSEFEEGMVSIDGDYFFLNSTAAKKLIKISKKENLEFQIGYSLRSTKIIDVRRGK